MEWSSRSTLTPSDETVIVPLSCLCRSESNRPLVAPPTELIDNATLVG